MAIGSLAPPFDITKTCASTWSTPNRVAVTRGVDAGGAWPSGPGGRGDCAAAGSVKRRSRSSTSHEPRVGGGGILAGRGTKNPGRWLSHALSREAMELRGFEPLTLTLPA